MKKMAARRGGSKPGEGNGADWAPDGADGAIWWDLDKLASDHASQAFAATRCTPHTQAPTRTATVRWAAGARMLTRSTARACHPPGCFPLNDINGDGRVDFEDINPFVAVLSGP